MGDGGARSAHAAAHQVCYQVWLATSMLADALGVAAQSLLARRVAARQPSQGRVGPALLPPSSAPSPCSMPHHPLHVHTYRCCESWRIEEGGCLTGGQASPVRSVQGVQFTMCACTRVAPLARRSIRQRQGRRRPP